MWTRHWTMPQAVAFIQKRESPTFYCRAVQVLLRTQAVVVCIQITGEPISGNITRLSDSVQIHTAAANFRSVQL